MIKKIRLNGEDVDLSIKALCHKGDYGNYKFTIEKKIVFDIEAMSKKLTKNFQLDKLHKLFMIIKSPSVSISIARHGRIMIEKVIPDTPERALEIAKQVLETIPGYEGIV
ncbi:MAG: hypothetical protein E3J78_07675 [Candidatus Cloacimonadota bacterium]|jgi:hypothetical protein|nr:MAG: hypothetical protein E3J78_07675 [Candidatus Cloacimonadota bacterium]